MNEPTVSPFWRAITDLTPDMKDKDRVALLRKITGVKQPTVSRWRTGVDPIGNRNALKVARHFECNVHWLQTYEGDRYTGGDQDPFISAMREYLDKLSEKDRAELVALAEIKTRGH